LFVQSNLLFLNTPVRKPQGRKKYGW